MRNNEAQEHAGQTAKNTTTSDFYRSFLALPKSKNSLKRVLNRIAFAFIFFALIDTAIMFMLNGQSDRLFSNRYRFENGTDISPIRLYAAHIRAASAKNRADKDAAKQQFAAFLGSSPAYGHRIKKSINTYPYSYESALNSFSGKPDAGRLITQTNRTTYRVYSLASNGQLL
ncbi:MAG: hypothetical protein HY779_05130, partial [Rubrobacteridae bacterium]|nr:hypothetical protein [Rubrobacteridae bacterium]